MSDPPAGRARRGWREKVEPGLYRAHRLNCARSADRRPGGRCDCPFSIVVPGAARGTTRTLTVAGTLTEARRRRARLRVAERPARVVSSSSPVTLDEFAAQYLRAREAVLAPAAVYTIEESYRLRVSPALGGLTLDQLTRERIEAWLAELVRASTSRRMVTKTVAALRVILAAAAEWGRIEANPAAGLRLPPEETHEEQPVERVLTLGQLRQLVAEGATSTRQAALLRVAGEAGLRRGELIGLRWPDLDLSARRLQVRRSVWHERTGPERGRAIEKATKGRRRRAVAISADLAAALGDLYAHEVIEGGAPADGLVWPGAKGGTMAADSPTQIVERAQRRCGLVDAAGRPLVTLHGLRHTAASIMLAAGVPLIVVSRQLGHANPNVTAQVYSHLLADSQLDEAAAVFALSESAPTLREALRDSAE
jgi:integrase